MKKFLASIAVGAVVASVLTGCGPASSIVPNTTLNVGESAQASNLNAGVKAAGQNLVSNQDIFELTQSSFYSLDASGNLVANELFGTAAVSDKSATSFTVDYTIADGVTWSDGQAITASDLLVSWVAARNPGKAGFTAQGAQSGLAFATKTPTIKDDGKTLSVVFDQPVADWQTALQLTVPAHLIGEVAMSEPDDNKAIKAVTEAIQSSNAEALKALAKAFNEGWKLGAASLDDKLFFSSGAYTITSATADEVVLSATTRCTWCRAPKVETVTLKFYASTDTLLQAMAAGEVDLAKPTESGNTTIAAIVPALDALSESGYKYTSVPSGRIEVLQLSYSNSSIFGPKSSFGSKNAVRIRDAFLKIVPRQRIVDSVSIPIKLTRADSFVYPSTSKYFSAVVQTNGSADYRIQDVEKAAELLKRFNLLFGIRVNMVFDPNNFREAIVFNLIAQNSKDGKIQMINMSSGNRSKLISKGDFEVYVKEMPLLGTDTRALGSLFTSSTKFKSDEVAGIIAKLSADPQSKTSTQSYADLDKELFDSGFGLPLFELPAVVAFNAKLKYYQPATHLQSVVWGYSDWNVEPEKKQ